MGVANANVRCALTCVNFQPHHFHFPSATPDYISPPCGIVIISLFSLQFCQTLVLTVASYSYSISPQVQTDRSLTKLHIESSPSQRTQLSDLFELVQVTVVTGPIHIQFMINHYYDDVAWHRRRKMLKVGGGGAYNKVAREAHMKIMTTPTFR